MKISNSDHFGVLALSIAIAMMLCGFAADLFIIKLNGESEHEALLVIAFVFFAAIGIGAILTAVNTVGDIFTNKFDDQIIRIEGELKDEAVAKELIHEIEEVEIEEEELGIIEFETEIKDLAFLFEDIRFTDILEEAGFY